MSDKHYLEASLLAFNAKNDVIFQQQLKSVKDAGVDIIHYDVMDGKFVPEIAYGPEHLQTLYLMGFKSFVHFMVKKPMKYVKQFLTYPLNAITFHPEPVSLFCAKRVLKRIRSAHVLAGIAIKPKTNIEQYRDLIPFCDLITVMGVEPGYGGQPFMGEIVIQQINAIVKLKNELNPNLIIQLDGGVNYEVMEATKEHVNNFISGSFLMKQDDKKKVVDFVKKL
ncbi:MAG: ribulose-phosphate 3-epimerase [Malacoplasma sp.]|nr:ribulose-phosphate 3-epimerase [Malacoplasma sp.]